MRHRKGLSVVSAIFVLFLMPGASAQLLSFAPGPTAFYLGGEAGWTRLANESATAVIPVIGTRSDGIDWRNGFNAGARFGVEWQPWRVEEEFRYQSNDVHKLENSAGSGSYNAAAIMTNVLYDLRPDWTLSPHIGVGLGAVNLDNTLNVKGLGRVITGSDWVFGVQAIGGLRYDINPTWRIEVDYRYLSTEKPHFHTGANFVDGGVPAPHVRLASGYDTHSVVASLIARFGPPVGPVVAPPAPPAPPPIARKVFLVFFDWDKDTITPDGMQIIQQAAAAFRAGAPVTIQVTGYTDRSGSPGYNQRLSERRANNVANAMVRLGVPRQAMAVSGRGENDNRVPTADGVREPQNRRVEIVFP